MGRHPSHREAASTPPPGCVAAALGQQHSSSPRRAQCAAQHAGRGAPVQRRLVDAAHLVEHKQAGQQYRQREDLGAVLPRLQYSTGGGRQRQAAAQHCSMGGRPMGGADVATAWSPTGPHPTHPRPPARPPPLTTPARKASGPPAAAQAAALATCLVVGIDALCVQQYEAVAPAVGAAALHRGGPHPEACGGAVRRGCSAACKGECLNQYGEEKGH